MREIKFRVWSMHSRNMYDLDFYLDLEGTLFQDDDLNYRSKDYYKLMQFTGLKDKNGKEIYEGDIIEGYTFDENINKNQVGRVSYHNGRMGYVFIPKELEKKNLYYPLFSIVTCELIGNIYENPELLNV